MRSHDRCRRGGVTACLLALLLVPLVASAAPSAGPEGVWQGSIMGVRLLVHVRRDAGGALTGTLDSPDQGAMGIPIDTLSFARDSLRFELPRLQVAYAGAMAASGDSITGHWSQGGLSLSLTLRRLDHAPVYRKPQDPVPPHPYDTLVVTYPNAGAGVTLAGTLTVPRGAGPFPCALLISGSGPQDRDETVAGHRPFLVLADHLTRRGVAVLRVDDRGVGASTGRFEEATGRDFADDVRAGIAFLKARREIDPKRIGLIGHSEGGLIAPLVAAGSKDVAFVVLLAGPGIPGDSLMMLQSAVLRRAMGVSEEAIARERVLSREMYRRLRQGDDAGVTAAAEQLARLQIEALPEPLRRAVGDPEIVATEAARHLLSPWMRFFATHDPRPTLGRLRCPVLALTGEKDLQVLPKENLAAMEAAFRSGGVPDATVRELPGLNHLFQTAGTGMLDEYARIQETFAPAALEEISRWILARTTGKR